MQSQNRFFDDLSKVATGAMGTAAGMAREFEATAKERFKEWVGGLDMVSREEFEAVRVMATRAMAEVDAMKAERAAERAAAGVATNASTSSTPTAAQTEAGAGPDGQPTL